LDDILLHQRTGLFHCGLPELQAAIHACGCTAPGELGAAWVEPVVPSEQLLAEGIGDILVVVEAAVQTVHVLSREQAKDVLLEVGAHQLSAALPETGPVQLLEERPNSRWNGRIEDHLCTARHDLVDGPAIVAVIEG